MPPAPELTVRVARQAEQRAALELALTPLAPSARGPLLDSFATAPPHPLGPLDALVVAVDQHGRVQAACWAQPSPGRSVALWPPEWAGERPADAGEIETRLTTHAIERCDAVGVPMVQALFERAEDPRCDSLAGCGFIRLAELIYLGRSVPDQGATTEAAGALGFEPFQPKAHARLKRVLRKTYVDSLDCPGIDGLRELDDVLLGYRATGRHHPDHWRFVTEGDADIGVLLLAEHPDANQAELIYVGLIPEARGKGYGARLLGEALAIAKGMGADHLMAAVDAANLPARKAYQRAGYAPWTTRQVLVRRLGGGSIS